MADVLPAPWGTGSILKQRAQGDRRKARALWSLSSRTVREELPWESSVLLKEGATGAIHELFWATILSQHPPTSRELYGQ